MNLLGLLPDNYRDWWKFSSLQSVSLSSGVKMGNIQFHFWAAAWIASFESFWVALRWTWFCVSGLLCREVVSWLHWLHSSIFCGVVCFATCLTGWINIFRLSFSSVTVFEVFVVVLVCIVVWDRAISATVFVSRIFLSIFRLFFLPF